MGHGTLNSPQVDIDEQAYLSQVQDNENNIYSIENMPPRYVPSPKHEEGHNFGSINPIKTQEKGQYLLDTGYLNKKQIYNLTESKKFVKFQPDNTPENGYHAYQVSSPRDIPPPVLKKMLQDGKISSTEYNKLRRGKKL